MARSILERLMGKHKAEAKYEPYNFGKKYDYTAPSSEEQLKIFDQKLVLVLDKMRQEGTSEQKEMIAFYEERAKQFLKVVSQKSLTDKGKFFSREMLGRSTQMFDDVLEGNDASENNEQCLLLIRDMDKEADSAAGAAAFFGFFAVTLLVTTIVLAATLTPIYLLFLMNIVHAGASSALIFSKSQGFSEQQEAMTSFTDAGKGFFSDAAEGEPLQEKESEKAPWYWPFGGGGEK